MTDEMKWNVRMWDVQSRAYMEETVNCKIDLLKLTDEELLSIKPVAQSFIEFGPFMLNVLHPKEHAKLRHMLAYLDHLRILQGQAIEREIENNDSIILRIKQKITRMQNG